MSKKEIIEIELTNEVTIHFFLEGVFWKAYERSAYLFSVNVNM
jgi:hypothetical protein